MFSSEYCEIFKSSYFEKHLLTVASDFLKQLQKTSEQLFLYLLTLLLSSDNLLTGYEQLSYSQFNRNLSIRVSLAKN